MERSRPPSPQNNVLGERNAGLNNPAATLDMVIDRLAFIHHLQYGVVTGLQPDMQAGKAGLAQLDKLDRLFLVRDIERA